MMRRTKFVPFLATTMALVAVAVISGREARAGAMGIAITGTGAPVLGTDPLFTYTFNASVDPGYTFSSGDYIEFVMVPGENGYNLGTNPILTSVFPTTGFGLATITPTGMPSAGATSPYSPGDTYTSDITWTYSGAALGSQSESVPIAVFTIQTNVQLTSLPQLVVFNSESQDSEGNNYQQTGIIPLNVPEPGSVVLLFTGVSALFLSLTRRRSGCSR